VPRSRLAKDSSSGAHLSDRLCRSCQRSNTEQNSSILSAVSRKAEERRRKAELRAKRADDENKRKVGSGSPVP
jgi:hypothetical protein